MNNEKMKYIGFWLHESIAAGLQKIANKKSVHLSTCLREAVIHYIAAHTLKRAK